MKPPIKAIKKIIKFCGTRSEWECGSCELIKFCGKYFNGIPHSNWTDDYKKLKKEVKEND